MGEHTSGYQLVRFGDRPWERRTEDDWPPLVKRVHHDPAADLSANIIWYARGVVEPRHVHEATHATWVLLGSAEMDGRRIGPGDLVYGPGTLPHGPLEYEMGCLLFGTLKGLTLHRAVDGLEDAPRGDGMPAHLALSESAVWEPYGIEGWAGQVKLMVDDPGRNYTARMVRWPAGSATPHHVHAGSHAALIVSGQAMVDGQILGPWDFVYGAGGVPHGGLEFPEECTLIVNTIGDPRVMQVR